MPTDAKEQKSTNSPDEIIHQLGGCGRFQLRMVIMVHLMKTVVCWSVMSMIFVTATPSWWCVDKKPYRAGYQNTSSIEKSCETRNGSECARFEFSEDMNTMVGEWELVCDRSWVPSTVTTIQLICQLFGNFFAGQLADTVGRKIPFFASPIIIMVSNLLGYFSVSWAMFTVARVFVGIGCGVFLTIQYNYLSEFTLARWRAWLVGFPSWPIQTCILALVLWLLKDWRKIHLTVAILCIPFMVLWWFMPESFRWYYGHDRIDDAEKVLSSVSKINRRPAPDMTYMKKLVQDEKAGDNRRYTVIDLFKSRLLIKISVLLAINWLALGLISYGLSFGIQKLSGSIYLNLFLFSIIGIPSKGIAIGLQNRFGRKVTSIMCFLLTGIASIIVGIVQNIDTDRRDSLTTGFAMVANLGMSTAWGPIQTMTIENYPTVVRNIGFGFCSVLTRVGAAVGPQLVYMDNFVPGLLYFFCGFFAFVCVCAHIGLPETMDLNLNDKLNEKREKEDHNDKTHDEKTTENGNANNIFIISRL